MSEANTNIPTSEQLEKYEALKNYLRSLGSAAVAFSGGVDSTLLLTAAKEALKENMIAVTASSAFIPASELTQAKSFCLSQGIRQIICDFDVTSRENITRNPPNRCYLCKKELFRLFLKTAEENGLACVVEGSNLDDTGDYRPGLLAIKELGIISPLKECGLWKKDIRAILRYLGLPVWDKPSFACLASRFVYGEMITEEKLGMVEQAEQLLMKLGFRQFRVRIHGTLARLEVLPEDFPRLTEENTRTLIVSTLKNLGFSYVSMDLAGYRSGSMNETLS